MLKKVMENRLSGFKKHIRGIKKKLYLETWKKECLIFCPMIEILNKIIKGIGSPHEIFLRSIKLNQYFRYMRQ